MAGEAGEVRLELGSGIRCGAAVVDLDEVAPGDRAESRRVEPAAELSERAGVRAREFVRQELEGCERVVIVTRHTDKYGRWLADLYYHPGWRDGKRILTRGHWPNEELVGQGLAGRYGR